MNKYLILSILLISQVAHAAEDSFPALQAELLARNPRVKALSRELAMLKQRIGPSAALDDPRVKVGVNSLSSRFTYNRDMTYEEFGISQMFPLWGKLSSRERIAVLEYRRAALAFALERAKLSHALRMKLYDWAAIEETERILEQTGRQLALVVESTVAASRAGRGSLANVVNANIEYTLLEEEKLALRQARLEARSGAEYLLGRGGITASPALPVIDDSDFAAGNLFERIAAGNQELKIARMDTEIAGELVSLKRKDYYPDLELGLSVMPRGVTPGGARETMVSAMASINLPLWFRQKNSAMVREMKERSQMAESLYADTRNSLMSRAGELEGRFNKWKQLERLYREKLLPQAALALETNLARYRVGSAEFMPIIDSVRMLLRYKKELVTARRERAAARSELAVLLGKEVLP